MASGRLVVSGTIDLSQFWPQGSSDADTCKILVTVEEAGFQYQEYPGAALKPTNVFDGAKVRGSSGTKSVQDKNGRVTVRLQGIDAPELHYMPMSALPDPPANPKSGVKYRTAAQKKAFLEWNKDYRQPLGETATAELLQFLKTIGESPLQCKVVTAVDEPNEVFDTYARLIGDILVGPNETNVNQWLVSQGWAFPAFYASMSAAEIRILIDLSEHAKSNRLGIWPHYRAAVGSLDWDRLYRRPKKNAPIHFDPAQDKGTVIFPKLFRRLTTWAVNRRAKMVQGSFAQYLGSQSADKAMRTDEFLLQGAAAAIEYPLASFLKAGVFTVGPADLVIKEKQATLLPAQGRDLHW